VYGSPKVPGFASKERLDQSSRAEATALNLSIVMARCAVAGLAAIASCAASRAQEAIPLPRLRPSIPPPLADIPLPRPRPAIVPAEIVAEPALPSDCQLRLTSDIAAIEALPAVTGAEGCGIDDPVRLLAVMTKDGARVAIAPPATMRCKTAEAIAHWIREDVAPVAATLGAPLGGIANFASYECRGRNRIVGAQISEHGKGNALDIRALTLTNGRSYELTDIAVAREARERIKASACARFTTVLGPASDGFHEGHVHVDVAERRSGYRICQWAVRDASDLVPLPRARPPEAPKDEP